MILLTLSRGKGEETVRLQLPASPAEIGETFAFLDRISLDTTATAILDVSSNVPVLYKACADDRVKLQRIRKAVEQGEFDILLVFMYDQLGRNLNETPFIAEWFTKKGIHVWSVYEGEIIDGVDAERMLDYIRFWQTDEAQKL